MFRHTALAAALAAAAFVLAPIPRSAAGLGFVATVTSTHPVAYYRLTATNGTSEVGTSTYKAVGGVSSVSSVATPTAALCAPISVPNNQCTLFDGKTGYFDTSEMGGIRGAGSIMAWVHLNSRPALKGRIQYVAGISQNANDFDLQFEPDNTIRFYTAAGSHVAYSPPVASLDGEWHLVIATFDASTGARAIYWDGKPGSTDSGGGKIGKTNQFSIGESKVFTGRFFDGDISDVALWNTALSPDTVAKILCVAPERAVISSRSVAIGVPVSLDVDDAVWPRPHSLELARSSWAFEIVLPP